MTLGTNSEARGRANDRMREELQKLLKEQAELAGLSLADVNDLETAAWTITVRRTRSLLEVLKSAAAVRARSIELALQYQPGGPPAVHELKAPPAPSYSDFDPKKPSRAVVACGHGRGVMLDWIGDGLFWAIEAVGTRVEDLGIEGPDGVWMWEGHYVDDGPGDWPGSREYALEGTHRPLTPEEWRHLSDDEHPWDPADWRVLRFAWGQRADGRWNAACPNSPDPECPTVLAGFEEEARGRAEAEHIRTCPECLAKAREGGQLVGGSEPVPSGAGSGVGSGGIGPGAG